MAHCGVLPHVLVVFGQPWCWHAWPWLGERHGAEEQATPHMRIVAYIPSKGALLHHLNRIDVETPSGRHTLLLVRLKHPAAPSTRWMAKEMIGHADFRRVAELDGG